MTSSIIPVSRHLDPRDPDALGYAPDCPSLQRARAAAAADPDLARAFEAQLSRETARFRAWAETYRRHGAGGVAFSGASVGAFAPAKPAEMLAQARRDAAVSARHRERREAFWRFTREMLDPSVCPGGLSASFEEG